jgi:hypothetical protein
MMLYTKPLNFIFDRVPLWNIPNAFFIAVSWRVEKPEKGNTGLLRQIIAIEPHEITSRKSVCSNNGDSFIHCSSGDFHEVDLTRRLCIKRQWRVPGAGAENTGCSKLSVGNLSMKKPDKSR